MQLQISAFGFEGCPVETVLLWKGVHYAVNATQVDNVLLQFFPFIKEIGATGVLVEWEDTFPYTKELIQLGGLSNSAQVCGAPYSIQEAKQILEIGEF